MGEPFALGNGYFDLSEEECAQCKAVYDDGAGLAAGPRRDNYDPTKGERALSRKIANEHGVRDKWISEDEKKRFIETHTFHALEQYARRVAALGYGRMPHRTAEEYKEILDKTKYDMWGRTLPSGFEFEERGVGKGKGKGKGKKPASEPQQMYSEFVPSVTASRGREIQPPAPEISTGPPRVTDQSSSGYGTSIQRHSHAAAQDPFCQSSYSAGAGKSIPPSLPPASQVYRPTNRPTDPPTSTSFLPPATQADPPTDDPPNPPTNPTSNSITQSSTNPVFRNLNKSQKQQVDHLFRLTRKRAKATALQKAHVWPSNKDVDELSHIWAEEHAVDYTKKLVNAGGGRVPKATRDEKDKCQERTFKRFGPARLPDNFSPDDGYEGFRKGSRAEKVYLASRRSVAPIQSPQAGRELDNPSSQQHENQAQPSALQGGRAVEHSPRHGAQAQQPHTEDDQDGWQAASGDELYNLGSQGRTPLRAGSLDPQGPGAPPFSGRTGLTPFSGDSVDASGESDPEHPRTRQPSPATGGGLPNVVGQSPLRGGVDPRCRAASNASSLGSSRNRMHTHGPSVSPPAVARQIHSEKSNSPLDKGPSPILTPNAQHMEYEIARHAAERGEPYQDQDSWMEQMRLLGSPSDQGHTREGLAPLFPQNLAAGQVHSRPSTSESNQSFGGGALGSRTNTPAPGTTRQPSGSMLKPQAKKSRNVTHAASSPGQGFIGSPPSAASGSPPPLRRREISNVPLRPSASPAPSTPVVTTPPIRQGTPRVQQARATTTPGPTSAPRDTTPHHNPAVSTPAATTPRVRQGTPPLRQARPATPSGPTSTPRNTTPHRNPAPPTVTPATGVGRGQGPGGAPHGSGNQGPANKNAKKTGKKTGK